MNPQVSPLFGIPLPGPISGYGGGTWNVDGTPATPDRDGQMRPLPGAATPVDPRISEDRYVERDGKHRGVAGVARDILGTLGDFLLTRLRMPAMYGPAQQRRREAAAMDGFEQDPISAINRLESINPEAGRRLREQHIDNQRIAASQAATIEARDARLDLARQQQEGRIRGYAASMLGSMSTWDEARRQQNYPQMREQVLRAAQRQGLDLSSELPESYDSIALDAFIDASVPVGTQRQQRLTAERNETLAAQGRDRIDVAERNAETSERRASRPRAIQTYTGEDGYRYTRMDDGSTVRSTTRVRETSRGTGRRAAPTIPREGEVRVLNGRRYVYRDGRAVRAD